MQSISAKDAKYKFGRLIDLVPAEPVSTAKHGRSVVALISVEEYTKMKSYEVARERIKFYKSEIADSNGVEKN